MARRKTGDKKITGKEVDIPKVQADDHSIAFEELHVGGNVAGDIRIGHTIGYTADQVSVLLKQITTTLQPKKFDGRCPYKGLDVFEEEDAELFFGRERLVNELVGRVKESRTVFITGPSGSGKSSLVRAGLIHALKQGAIKGSERWLYETMKPGREPLKDLALAFSRLKSPELQDYFLMHLSEADILDKCAESVLSGKKDQRFVLFVDQFEEIFTQINQEEERVAFINMLAHAGTVENGRVIVLFAMRSDFVSNCATYPLLNELLSQEFRQIGAMQPDELVSAIALPARHVGLPIEDELIARIINDMKGEPDALPLMQFALKDLFDAQQAEGGFIALTLKDYLKHGGIQQSLERHADATFAKLSESEQELTRSIFSGLIEIGRGTQDTKRTALFDELIPANTKPEEVGIIVQKLADARLIVTDEQGGKDTVTISHEKLIEAWPWLKKLVNENRDAIALQNEIASDAKEWDDHKRDESYLYSGARLSLAQEQVTAQKIILSGLAKSFIEEGIILRESERKTKELLRRRITIGLISGIAIALVLAAFAVYQMFQAQKQATISGSQALAANSQLQKSTKSQLSLLLALEAFDLVANLPHSERLWSEQAVRDALSQIQGISLIGHIFAFSPDGRWLATGGEDGTVRLSNMNDLSTEPIVLGGHDGTIDSLAFSPDGLWLATGSSDATARLWDVKDLSTEPIILSGLDGSTEILVAFSPDGHWLATGSGDDTVRLWDMNDPSAKPVVYEDYTYTLAFSPDGRWLATGSLDATIRLWDMKQVSAEPIILSGHEDYISNLNFSLDGRWLAVRSGGGIIHLWDMSNLSAKPMILHGHESDISTLAISRDGHWLAATGDDNTTARLWDVNNPSAEPIILSGHEDNISTLNFSPDGRWLATGSLDATVRLWDMNDLSAQHIILHGHESPISTLAFSPDGRWLAAAGDDNTTRLWDLKEFFAEPLILRGHESTISTVAFSSDGRLLATGSWDATIRLWDMNELFTEPIILRGHDGNIYSLAFSPDGHWLASGSRDNTTRLWDMNYLSAEPIILSGPENFIDTVAFSPDGHWLATGSEDSIARLWDMNDLSAEPIVYEDYIYTLAFSPDGHWLATGGLGSTARLWDMNDLSAEPIILSGHEDAVFHLTFSPDGRWLATGSGDNTTRLWDMNDLSAEPIILRGHEDVINTVTFSPDGRWLATGSADATARLWDMNDLSAEPIILRGHEHFINTLAFSPNGRWLATGSADATARLWSLNIHEVIETACQFIGRNFTRAEWAQYFPNEDYRKTCDQWPLEPELTPTAIP